MALDIKIPEKIEGQRIGSALNGLFSIITQIEKSDEQEVNCDFQNAGILTPTFLLPFLIYINECGKKVNVNNVSSHLESYFKAIHFPNILDAEKMGNDFQEYMKKFSGKRYIPIIKFPALAAKDDIKNRILDSINCILKYNLKLESNINDAMNYLLSELIDNITEHSKAIEGYIFAQYYPKMQYIDIVIIDKGITLLGSYIKTGNKNVQNDLDALKKATAGVSTKNLPSAENRGYGITTSRKMLSKGLKGQFFMFSGNAFYRQSSEEEQYINLSTEIKWEGTMIILRIPYSENKDFSYVDYIS